MSFSDITSSRTTPGIISSRLLTPSGNLTTQTTLIIEHDDCVDSSEIQYPESVSKLIFRQTNANSENVISFPNSIEELELDVPSSGELVVLPKFLKKLVVGDNFNDVSELELPNTLTHLTFGRNCFCKDPEDLKFPETLTHLTLSSWFTDFLGELKFPESVTDLTIKCHRHRAKQNDVNLEDFPKSVKIVIKIMYD